MGHQQKGTWGIPDPPTLRVASGSLQCSGIEDSSCAKRILVLFTPAAPPCSPLVAGSKSLSLLLGPAVEFQNSCQVSEGLVLRS
ncbi:hypothetical protein AV530_003883 [Patagioenas fasciata monilis]|uniref:Uncharacterized protein n=1 Tax=Patagioenas fasciata monilis TaxID=372326 RepID=A0A1V4KZ51_PATFA|nr:hypothetical protein AV530_003883 [Patagioenas fasciata monilis]